MANKNAPFGARVVGKLGSAPQVNGTTEYAIASGASGNIFSGDLVKMTNAGTIFVIDDPDAVFEIQSAGSPAQTDVGLNADISYTAGSVKTGMSAMELSGTTAATTATFRIMGFSSDPDNSTTGSANVNVIVKFNEHFYVDPTGV